MKKLMLTLSVLLVTGCALVGKFDQNSYNAAQSLQQASLALMGQRMVATPTNDIVTLQARLQAQVAYEQGKLPANKIPALQWQILTSTNGNLLGEFLVDWLNGSNCSPAYLTEKESQINQGFAEIMRLEGGLLK
jgi:hypothetical protein